MWQIVDALQTALVAPDRVTDFRFDVIDEAGRILSSLLPTLGEEESGVLGGQVTCTADGIRWSGSLTVVGDALVPRRAGDLLHPLTYNRVRPWVRVRLADGTWDEIPMAPMYVDAAPSLSDSGLAPTVVADLSLSDAVALIKRAGWRTSLQLGGKTAHAAIQQIVEAVAPWLTVMVTAPAVPVTLPTEYDVGEPGGDPWADVETLCEAGGLIAYIDREGVLRVEEQPTTTAVRWQFSEGLTDCLMVDISAEVDLGDIENVIAVTSNSEAVDPPITGWWEDEDVDSPLYAGAGHVLFAGPRANPAVTTLAQAHRVAAAIGATMKAATQVVAIQTIPVPHLDPWDNVDVARQRIGVTGLSQIRSWTIDLDPTALMAVTTSGRVTL